MKTLLMLPPLLVIDADGFMSYTYAQPANVSVAAAYAPGGEDTIHAGTGKDEVQAGGGKDFWDGRMTNKLINDEWRMAA